MYGELLEGKLSVNKCRRVFSAIAINQSHEQNNACVKGDGVSVCLTENLCHAALVRWKVSGPEMARLIGEFEKASQKKQDMDYNVTSVHRRLSYDTQNL